MSMNLRFYLSYDIKSTLKSHFCHKKRHNFVIMYVVMDVISFPENLKTTSGLSILLHGVISLPDAKSYDNMEKTLSDFHMCLHIHFIIKLLLISNNICR